MNESAPYRYAAAWLTFHAVMIGVARFLVLPFALGAGGGLPTAPLVLAGAFCSFLLWFGVSWAAFRWTVHELVIKPPFVRRHCKAPDMDELPYTEAWVVYLGLSAALLVLGGLALTLWPPLTASKGASSGTLVVALALMAFVLGASFASFRWAVRTRLGPHLPPDEPPALDA